MPDLFDRLTTLADVQRLIDEDERESEVLEYKTAPAPLQDKEKNEAAKDISAFANAMGGLLVYGVATHPKDKSKPIKIEGIVPAIVDQGLLAANRIRHPIDGIRSKTIDAGDGRLVLLIDVPASPLAPHQVMQAHRYYRRQGMESVPMSHDLVELYFGRRLGPVLEPRLVLEPVNSSMPRLIAVRLTISLFNAGAQAARHAALRVVWPRNAGARAATLRTSAQLPRPGGQPGGRGSGQTGGLSPTLVPTPPNTLLYPGLAEAVVEYDVFLDADVAAGEAPVLWIDCYADGMRPRRYHVLAVIDRNSWSAALRAEYLGAPPPD